ncbi:MAG: hypothetical protein ACLFOY_05615 [Desulfatibacillaceae bacterium]
MIRPYALQELLPHGPEFILVSEVVETGPTHGRVKALVREDWPLARDRRVDAILLVEVMAQAAGTWIGSRRKARGEKVLAGFLVGIKEARFHRPFVKVGEELAISLDLRTERHNFTVVDGQIISDGETVMDGLLQFATAESGDVF